MASSRKDGSRLDVSPGRRAGDEDAAAGKPRRVVKAELKNPVAAAEPKRAAAPGRAAEPKHPDEPRHAAEPKRPSEPGRAAEPKRTAASQRGAEPKQTVGSRRAAAPKQPAAKPKSNSPREPEDAHYEMADEANAGSRSEPKPEPQRSARSASAAASPPGTTRRSGPRRRFPILRFAVKGAVTLTLLAVVAVGAVIAYYAQTLPPKSEWRVPVRPPNVAIMSADGQLIANRGDTGGRNVKLADLPKYVPEAVIAIEDRRFYSHVGLDPIGLARAISTNLARGRMSQGGSTLTQQLAKNLFLNQSRTLERKIQEAILAVWLEVEFSKEEILELYLNRVYLGAGATGIDGAAHRYFDKGAEDLTIAEAAMIAGLLKAPSTYAPTANIERARDRAAVVVHAMAEESFITPEQEADALANPAALQVPKVAASSGYVADWVNEVLDGFAGDISEDVVVETTVDLELQQLAQSSLQKMLKDDGKKMGVSQGAVVVLDSSGAVMALVGGRSYAESQFNRAVDAMRQPGSAFKPFVYLAALEHGMTPDTVRVDQPTRIGNWSPENYTRKYYGPVSLTRALAHSLNTISVQLTAEMGPEAVASVARRLGIRSPIAPNASIALGTSEVTPLELTAAFVPFSNGGVGVIPHVVRRIKTNDGRIIYERRGGGPGEVISIEHVGEMNRMLSTALNSGTGERAKLDGWQAGGKTGTSQNWRDAWFVGYTAYFTAGVWLGNDDGSPTKKASGGTLPAGLWKTMMTAVLKGMTPADLPGMDIAPEVVEVAPTEGIDQEGWGSAEWQQRRELAEPVHRAPDDERGGWITPEQNVGGERPPGFLRRLMFGDRG